MSKKIITILLSAIMMLTFMPAMAFAEDMSFTDNGIQYTIVDDEAVVTGVTSKFDGTFVNAVKYDGVMYDVSYIEDPLVWKSKVSTVYIPNTGFLFGPNAFKNASTIKGFVVYTAENSKEPDHYADRNGLIYENEWYDGELESCTLVMYPPAKTGLKVLELADSCDGFYENAFDYSKGAKDITKLVLQNDGCYIDRMDYEDTECLFDRLAKKPDGKYNLTIRLLSNGGGNIDSFVGYVKYRQSEGISGIKLEAPIECIGVKDVTYADRNKARQVVFGRNCLLTEGEDYVIGDQSKVNGLGSDYYCVLVTGSNNFFLGSDEEPWEEFSVVSEYSVTPNKVAGIKISSGKGKFAIKWTADKTKYGKSGKVDGYQIAYKKANSSKYSYKRVKGYKQSTKTVKSLKKGKYSVKLRSYKTIGDTDICSPWSAVKTVRVK